MNKATAMQINAAETQVKSVWSMIKPLLLGIGVTLAAAVAATALVPDSAVKTKEELDNNTELSKQELIIRKAVVPILVAQYIGAVKAVPQIGSLMLKPGIESKLRAAAKLLQNVPGFFVGYKMTVKSLEERRLNVNPREVSADMGVGKRMALSGAASFLNGAAKGFESARV